MKFFKLTFISLLLPLVSHAVDLRQVNIYRGQIHLYHLGNTQKHIGNGCLVKIKENISDTSDQYYDVTVKSDDDKNAKGLRINEGRNFKALLYNNYLEGRGSSYNVQVQGTQTYRAVQAPKHTLHINFLNQVPFSALILEGEKVIVNCANLRLDNQVKK